MLLFIDNYDSFSYNLVQYFGELGEKVDVFKNDKFDVNSLARRKYSALVVSPGPGKPENAGVSCQAIRKAAQLNIPILGVCLGLQAIVEVFGGRITNAPSIMHGRTSEIFHSASGLFNEIPSPFTAMRYHSLVVENSSIPRCLNIDATTEDKVIMAISHKTKTIHAVQFHPESILTDYGHKLLKNFLEIC